MYHRVNGFPEFIVSTLKTLEMWEDIDFWLYCFFCDNAQRREKLAPNFRSSADDWATMNTKERDDVCLKDETSLYNVIGEICYSVALVGISDAMFKNFIERCAITIRMNETQTGTLMTFAVNIVNSNRASLEQANVEKRSVEGAAEKLFKISKRRGMQPMTHKVLDINMNNSYERLRLGTKKMSKVQRDGFSVTVYELDVGEVIRLIVRDNIVVGGTTSGVVTVWDYKSKRPFLFDFNTHTDGVSALDMDSATSTILVGTRDCKAFAYDLKRRAIIEIFDGHKAQIPSVHIHKRFFLSGSDDKALGIWNRESKGPFHLLQGHAGAILCITTVDAPRRLMLGLDDKEDNDPTKEDKGSNEPQGTPITVNEPTTTFAVTGSEDGSIRVWDLDKLECVIVLKGHCDWVTQVIVVSPTVILSKSADRTVKLWDLERKECVQTYGDEDIIITAFAYNAGEIFAGCEDGTIIRWKLRNPLKPALKFKVVASTVTHISSNIDNSIIITACQDGNMYLWNDSGNVITTLRGHTDTVNTLQTHTILNFIYYLWL